MHKNTAGNWQRAALVVAAGLLAGVAATPASAQFRKDDGRALDANPRSGSGGQNETARDRTGQAVTGNQIITGNVTGGRQFRGPVPYSDPGDFRGVTSSLTSDRFVRASAGTPRPFGGPEINMDRPTAFYGSGRALPPPQGFVSTSGATGGFIPTRNADAQPNVNRIYNPALDPSFRMDELVLPARDGSDQDSVMTASPLYGVRVWRAGESPNDFLSGERQNQGNADPADRFRADPNSIQRMRDELNRTGQGADGNQTDDQGTGDGQGRGQGEGSAVRGLERSLNLSPRIGGPDESSTPAGGSVAAGQLSSAIGTGPIGSSVSTGQSIRRNLVVAPEKQTPQLARLRRAYERRQGTATSDAQAARQFNNEIRAQRTPAGGAAAPAPRAGAGAGLRGGAGVATPPAPSDAALPPETPAPAPADAPTTLPDAAAPQPQQPPVPEAPPEKIESIAEGVEAKGLRDVLKSAEDLMRGQKFAAALEKYDVARQVAPNNSLITMGRANAELAASYYRRAEQSLREAVGRAPELVVAQFDLKALVGPERLQVLVRDLKEIAANDKQVARPMILLAYIAYNTGNEAQAGEYLAAAEQRAGGDDALLSAWRKNWTLPKGAAPADDLNK
jgi:hypothetical protein